MSRCLPYPPPGYNNKLNRSSSISTEALIESIKLQREREQAKAERKKEKRREKKEKQKDKKGKANPKHGHFDRVEKSWIGPKDGFLHCVREEDYEQLERSSLTEEHEQPIRSQNPSSSFDSTQTSNKRKRHTSPAIVREEGYVTRGHGNIIRIRLSSQKQQGVNASVAREEPCSTSGRTLPAQQEHQIAPRAVQENLFPTPQRANDVILVLPHRPDGEQFCSTSGKTVAVINENASTSSCKRPEKKLRKLELQREDLIEKWIPPSLQTELDFGDKGWLLGRKYPENQIERKFKASNDISCSSSSVLWPRAQFLPEADIYSLPFTVPF